MKKYYLGFTNEKGNVKSETRVYELKTMAQTRDDFFENDIVARKNRIIDSFIQELKDNNLMQ